MPSCGRRTEGFRRETHIPTQHPSPFQEAWIPRPYGYCRRPCHSQGPSGQGPLQAVGLIQANVVRGRTVSGCFRVSTPTSARRPVHPPRPVGRVDSPRRFRALQGSSTRLRSGPLRASWAPASVSGEDEGQGGGIGCVAYAITTSVGNAVNRNRVRRRLRHAVGDFSALLPPGDLLIRVVGSADRCSWPVVRAAVEDLFVQLQPLIRPWSPVPLSPPSPLVEIAVPQ